MEDKSSSFFSPIAVSTTLIANDVMLLRQSQRLAMFENHICSARVINVYSRPSQPRNDSCFKVSMSRVCLLEQLKRLFSAILTI